MEIQKLVPLILYDDSCYVCIKFAEIVNFLGRGKIKLIGQYSTIGERIIQDFLDSTALDMFWYIDSKTAYGGRAAIGPLIKSIIFSKSKKLKNEITIDSCDLECKNPKSVFLRSFSLLSHHNKIKL